MDTMTMNAWSIMEHAALNEVVHKIFLRVRLIVETMRNAFQGAPCMVHNENILNNFQWCLMRHSGPPCSSVRMLYGTALHVTHETPWACP